MHEQLYDIFRLHEALPREFVEFIAHILQPCMFELKKIGPILIECRIGSRKTNDDVFISSAT